MSRLARIAVGLALVPVFVGAWWYFERPVPMDPSVAALCREPTAAEVAWLEEVDREHLRLSTWWTTFHGTSEDPDGLARLVNFAPPAGAPDRPVPRVRAVFAEFEARDEEQGVWLAGHWDSPAMDIVAAKAHLAERVPSAAHAPLRAWVDALLGMGDVERLGEAARLAQVLRLNGVLTAYEWERVSRRVAEGVLVCWVNELQLDPARAGEPHRWGRWIDEVARELRAVETWRDLTRVLEQVRDTATGAYGPDWRGSESPLGRVREELRSDRAWGGSFDRR